MSKKMRASRRTRPDPARFAGTGGADECGAPPQNLQDPGPFVFRFPGVGPLPDHCYGEAVIALKALIRQNDWEKKFLAAITSATGQNVYGYPPMETMDDLFNFLQFDVATWVPLENQRMRHIKNGKALYIRLSQYYFFFDQPSLLALQSRIVPHADPNKLKPLSAWMVNFVEEWGAFLDSTASFPPEAYEDIMKAPTFKMEEYEAAPSGYQTYNQWFARNVRPGARPVDAVTDDEVIVTPADCQLVGYWPIDENGEVVLNEQEVGANHMLDAGETPQLKGYAYSIRQLLKDAPEEYRDAFNGGVFAHAFLNANDFHRLHVPARGVVRVNTFERGAVYCRIRVIPEDHNPNVPAANGRTGVTREDAFACETQLDIMDETGWQFFQDRGLVIVEGPNGLIATLPMGMAQVSRVVPTADVGANLLKGQEFSYFKNGGSDIAMVFSKATSMDFTWERDDSQPPDPITGKHPFVHKLQGETMGRAAVCDARFPWPGASA